MSDVKTRPESHYTKRILHTFASEKSVLIEIDYYYPIGPQVSFVVSGYYNGQPLVKGVFYRDAIGDVTTYEEVTALTRLEIRELTYKIYEEVDKVLEMIE
ncbi:hypothetical protein [Leptospira noguchii]|uniref:hypothetical protein n=1 Tax=Leptospira noguchii TaxID=28182 RepID=UPI00077371A7|nr:hypothetical protein [Leptospira noguchii]